MKLQLLGTPARIRIRVSGRCHVQTLSVDTHAGGYDQLIYRLLDKPFQQDCRSQVIHAGVLGYLVHALAHSDKRHEMVNGINTCQNLVQQLRITNVAKYKLSILVQVIGAPWLSTMNLGNQAVQNTT